MSAFALPVQTPPSFRSPKRVLMGPGPSEVSPLVQAAMSQPAIGYLDPAFIELMEQIKALLRYTFQTGNALTFPLSGPGSVGMETCFVNLVTPGDEVIVCRNGVFGGRMIENVQRCGGVPVVVDDAWGHAIDPNKLEDALKAHPDARIVGFVHAETSTGCISDARLLAELAHAHGRLVVADAVTSLGGSPLRVDEWGLDVAYSASQKCLSSAPGVSPVTFSPQVVDHIMNRKQKVQSWFMDLGLILSYWNSGSRTYHHTAPTHNLFALHEALTELAREGIEQAWARHHRNYLAFQAGIEAMELTFLVREEMQAPQLSAVRVPPEIDATEVRSILLTEFDLEIGAGLGPLAGKIWRFGLMGHSSRADNVMLCLTALGTVLSRMGLPIDIAAAAAAADRVYATYGAGQIESGHRQVAMA